MLRLFVRHFLRSWARHATVLALSGVSLANASGLQVSPVSLTLAADQHADTLWVSNAGNQLMRVQVRAYGWRQRNGQNQYENTQRLLVSPPFVQLAPGYRQLIRVIRSQEGALPLSPSTSSAATTDENRQVEQAFRLIIDELPGPDHGKGSGLVMRYSIPVFLRPDTEAKFVPNMHWQLHRLKDDVMLEVSNSGTMHGQLADVRLTGAKGCAVTVHSGLLGYVLPQATMRWMLPAAAIDKCRPSYVQVRLNGAAPSEIRLQGSYR